MSEIERKSFSFEIKAVSEDGKTFEGYCSTWEPDLGDDQVVKGAFAASIKQTKGVIPILWQHDQKQPIGWNLEAKEDDNGLYIKGELMQQDPLAQKAREWMALGLRVGGKVGLSIGYRVVDSAPGAKGVRLLKQLDLVEYSVVTWAMNQAATVTAVKKCGDKMKEFKAEDFNSSLAEAQAMSALYQERWKMDSALCDACTDVCEDTGLTLDDKKAAIGKNFGQYATAMTAWWAKYLDLTADEPEADAGEEKAGRTISAATVGKIKTALETHAKAMDMHRDAMKMHRKGIGQMHSIMTYAGQYQADRNAPNPMGNNKGETEDQVRLLSETIRNTRKALRAA